jgi:SHS family sialic acid transporter-like MFS transporter
VLRFVASLGMGGEWALGVALVMEVWPNRSRALMAGLIGAAANVGYMLVGFVGLVLAAWLTTVEKTLLGWGVGVETVQSLVAFKGWRLLMIMGTTPAILTFFFRLFVPESEKWQEQNSRGTTSHWKAADLFGVLVGAFGPGLIILAWAQDWSKSHPESWMGQNLGLVRWGSIAVGLLVATIGIYLSGAAVCDAVNRGCGAPL